MLMFWEGDKVEIIPTNKNHFLDDAIMVKAIFYSPYVKSITLAKDYKEGFVESCGLTTQGFKIRT